MRRRRRRCSCEHTQRHTGRHTHEDQLIQSQIADHHAFFCTVSRTISLNRSTFHSRRYDSHSCQHYSLAVLRYKMYTFYGDCRSTTNRSSSCGLVAHHLGFFPIQFVFGFLICPHLIHIFTEIVHFVRYAGNMCSGTTKHTTAPVATAATTTTTNTQMWWPQPKIIARDMKNRIFPQRLLTSHRQRF